ncbi:Antigen peptide transporter 2 [Blyttiomyces sp. JEL0837]|nr:Antigen peptide transporter 2 [Blyttiomyces sp. JEL0837]
MYQYFLKFAVKAHELNSVVSGVGWGLYGFFMFLGFALAFGVGGVLTSRGVLTPGQVLNAFMQIAVGITALGNLGSHYQSIAEADRLLKGIQDILNTAEITATKKTGQKIPDKDLKGRIVFENVVFRYPSRPDFVVLDGFNLTIKPGKRVGIVAKSGVGKSTLFALLLKLYSPQSGRILLDGVDIAELDTTWLRQQIGLVSQDTDLFEGTIEFNIKLGHTNPSSITSTELTKTCKISHVDEIIKNLPDGISTYLTSSLSNLSGGQRQRVGIARAIIQQQRKLLLLDEATSALDSGSERIVLDGLLHGSNENDNVRTMLVISHRLSVMVDLDFVVFVEGGRVVESGTHEELMRIEEGRYRKLVLVGGGGGGDFGESAFEKGDDQSNTVAAPSSVVKTVRKLEAGDGGLEGDDEKGRIEVGLSSKKEEVMIESVPWDRVWNISAPHSLYIALGLVGSLLEGLQFPLQGYFIASVISSYSLPPETQFKETLKWSLSLAGLGLLTLFTGFSKSAGFGITASRTINKLRGTLFKAILRQDVSFFQQQRQQQDDTTIKKDNVRMGYDSSRLEIMLQNDCQVIDRVPGPYIADLVQGFVNVVVGVGISLWTSWKVTIFVVLCVPVVVGFAILQDRLNGRVQVLSKSQEDRVTQFAITTLAKSRTISLLTAEHVFINNFKTLLHHAIKADLTRDAASSFLGQALTEMVLMLFTGFGLLIGGRMKMTVYRGDAGETLTHGEVMTVLTTMTMTAISAAKLAGAVAGGSLASTARSLREIWGIVDLVPRINGGNVTMEEENIDDLNSGKDAICFENVSFSYGDSENSVEPDDMPQTSYILRNVSFKVQKGSRVAIVGKSGSGKSTLLKLLLRLYDPTNGAISLYSKNLCNLSPHQIRSRIVSVQQNPVLFNRSVADNIAAGRPFATREDIINAAKCVGADSLISLLSEGYETVVGEKGSRLSGGQRQLIALARAYICDPEVVLLDEATSALDAEHEKTVLDALEILCQGRTTIIVSHRLSMVIDADQIIVMDQGKICEMGTHAELVKLGNRYFSLAKAQGLL